MSTKTIIKGRPIKKSRKSITFEVKHKIMRLYESGMKVKKLAEMFKMPHSSVSTIIRNKERYMDQVKNSIPMQSTIVRKKEGIISEVEKNLISWINHQNQKNNMAALTQASISEKALSLHETIKSQGGEIGNDKKFIASKGWFVRFRRRAGWYGKDYAEKIAEIIEEGNYCSRQVFNVHETCFLWKQIPSKDYTFKENLIPDVKNAEDRVTLLLAANAAGDFKLKPLLIVHNDNPEALKGFIKTTLPVIWKSNSNARMTATIFEEWLAHHFISEVTKYCHKHKLPCKVMLIMDKAPCHAPILEHCHPDIKIVFMPPDATPLQPMIQGIVPLFKVNYFRIMLEKIAARIDKNNGSKEIWKNINILDAVKTIKCAWSGVSSSHINSAWEKLCPQFVQCLEHLDKLIENVTEELTNIGTQLNIKVTKEDVNELLYVDDMDPSNEDIIKMTEQGIIERKSKKDLSDARISSRFSVNRLSEAFGLIEAALQIFETDDPNFKRSSQVISTIRRDITCYKNIYQEKTSSIRKPSYFLKKYEKMNALKNAIKKESIPADAPDVTNTSLKDSLIFEYFCDPNEILKC